jgi:ABC-2 type transport system ATP-binding protein
VLVSSHLLAEMALMADDLVVIGRGELISTGSVADFVGRFTRPVTVVRSPQAGLLAALLAQARAGAVTSQPDGSLLVEGADLAVVGDLAGRNGLTLHELSQRAASLEDAFLEATGQAAEYRARPGSGRRRQSA